MLEVGKTESSAWTVTGKETLLIYVVPTFGSQFHLIRVTRTWRMNLLASLRSMTGRTNAVASHPDLL
jgi:hypothetical protein